MILEKRRYSDRSGVDLGPGSPGAGHNLPASHGQITEGHEQITEGHEQTPS